MKLAQRWMLSIILMIVSLNSFSQTVTDSTTIRLKKPIVKLVIKDLIKGDGAKKELILYSDKIKLFQEKIILKDSVILNLNTKVNNFNSILITKSDQLSLSQELSKKLEQDLKKQKFKNKLTTGAGILAVIVTAILVK